MCKCLLAICKQGNWSAGWDARPLPGMGDPPMLWGASPLWASWREIPPPTGEFWTLLVKPDVSFHMLMSPGSDVITRGDSLAFGQTLWY